METGRSNCGTCAKLIRLTSGLSFFPADDEVRRLLIERLHRVAKDHEHARAMVTHWIDTQREAPKVADLFVLAGEVSTSREALPAPCDECAPYGGTHRLIIRRGTEFMARCVCARGQRLAAMDARASPGRWHRWEWPAKSALIPSDRKSMPL